MAIHDICGQQFNIYDDNRTGLKKLRFMVNDYMHPQLSTYGCLHESYDYLYNFAKRVIERMGTVNTGKTEAIREACKYVKHKTLKIAL
jgi:hypothetical protein